MSVIRKSACRWFRNLNVHYLGAGMESTAIVYHPGRVCVEYETGTTLYPLIRRVVIYEKATHGGKMKIEAVVTEIPQRMEDELFGIVQDNERSYGCWITAILLPNGRIIHV